MSEQERSLSLPQSITLALAFISVELYFISPLYFIYKFNKNKITVGQVTVFQIFMNFINCLMYNISASIGYGNEQNLFVNALGILLCVFVLLDLYFSFKNKKKNTYLIYFFTCFNVFFEVLYFLIRQFHEEPTALEKTLFSPNSNSISLGITEYICVFTNFCMYFSLNQNDVTAFREKKAEKIPILSVGLGLISSFFWLIYGFLVEEKTLMTEISNGASFAVLLVPFVEYVILRVKFRGKKREVSEDIIYNGFVKSKVGDSCIMSEERD